MDAPSSVGSGPPNTNVCPFPQSWYPSGDPCSQTSQLFSGAPQNPLWSIPDVPWGSEIFDTAVAKIGDATSSGKTLFYVAGSVLVGWLVIRGLEAWATIRR